MESGLARGDVFITSKLWGTKHHAGDVEDACRKSLKDLGLTYLDLYLIHWPTALKRGDNPFPKNADGSMQVTRLYFARVSYLMLNAVVYVN